MPILKKYSFLAAYLLLFLPLLGWSLGGVFLYLPIIVVFILIPTVDNLIRDNHNPDKASQQTLLKDKFFKYLTITYAPLQCIMLAICLYAVEQYPLPGFQWLLFALSVGLITGGIGITVAHELIHKNSASQKFWGKVLLVSVCYGHFFIEHIRGHHVNVATPADPASAHLDESIYAFYPRTLIKSWQSAWRIENQRLKKNRLPIWKHNFGWIIAAPILICLVLAITLGYTAVLFFLIQSLVAFSLLEIVNYVEHYGLTRKKLADGTYERVSPKHSWNANHWLSNLVLFHLQRHSDHHTHAGRPYQNLHHLEQSPQLPTGYPGMIILALIPPLWFRVMNPKVKQYLTENNSKDDSDINTVNNANQSI